MNGGIKTREVFHELKRLFKGLIIQYFSSFSKFTWSWNNNAEVIISSYTFYVLPI